MFLRCIVKESLLITTSPVKSDVAFLLFLFLCVVLFCLYFILGSLTLINVDSCAAYCLKVEHQHLPN